MSWHQQLTTEQISFRPESVYRFTVNILNDSGNIVKTSLHCDEFRYTIKERSREEFNNTFQVWGRHPEYKAWKHINNKNGHFVSIRIDISDDNRQLLKDLDCPYDFFIGNTFRVLLPVADITRAEYVVNCLKIANKNIVITPVPNIQEMDAEVLKDAERRFGSNWQ